MLLNFGVRSLGIFVSEVRLFMLFKFRGPGVGCLVFPGSGLPCFLMSGVRLLVIVDTRGRYFGDV